jgi:hypothetical protein
MSLLWTSGRGRGRGAWDLQVSLLWLDIEAYVSHVVAGLSN